MKKIKKKIRCLLMIDVSKKCCFEIGQIRKIIRGQNLIIYSLCILSWTSSYCVKY